MCISVVQALETLNLPFAFYEVQRGWGRTNDRYLGLEQLSPNDLMIVSDLFNFKSIAWDDLPKTPVLIDYAHCPMSAMRFAPDSLFPASFIFSFGRGKYTSVDSKSKGALANINNKSELAYLLADFMENREFVESGYSTPTIVNELPENFEVLDAPGSSRVVVRCKDSLQAAAKLRSEYGLAISDGLFDYVLGSRRDEFYIWKEHNK